MPLQLVDRIEDLFNRHGRRLCSGDLAEPVSALARALQCAQFAERAGANKPLVAAALLHDIGHFMHAPRDADDMDDAHELRAMPLLSRAFGPSVTEPIRWHVHAKRYLVATDPSYAAVLTLASAHSLAQQGGPMTVDEQRAFERLPHAQQALQLRRWDDAAKEPGRAVPPLAHYLALLRELIGTTEAPHLLTDALDFA
jgi:phosphonate degradation associated HDIG domain protein